MYDTFTLDVDQASELKHAAKRNGVTNADLKVLSSGEIFAQILPFLRGRAQVVISSVFRIVDTVKIDVEESIMTDEEYFKSAGVRDFFTDDIGQYLGILVPPIREEISLVVREIEQDTTIAQVSKEIGAHAEIDFLELRQFLLSSLKSRKIYNSSQSVNFYIRNKRGERQLIHAQMHAGAGNWSLHAGGTGATLKGDVWLARK